MAGEKKVNSNLDVEGSIKVTTVPNSTGTLVTFNDSTKVFGTRTNEQIISDLNLSSNFVPTSRTLTINGTTFDLSANRTWNIPDNDTITRLRGTTSGTYTSGDLTLLAGSNTTITQSGANITISSTNTNTTYTAGTGLTLTGTVFTPTFGTAAGTVAQGNHTHTFASITSKPTTLSGYGITDAPTKTGTGASGTWGISISGNAASSNILNRYDQRTLSPSLGASRAMRFGFTSWNNNNTAPYADFIHMRSYQDSSGGSDNLITFLKEGIGMRIWQQNFGLATAYSSYKDVAFTDGSNSTGTWGISITGNAATATSLQTARTLTIGNTGKTFDGTSNVSWSLAEIGAQSILTNPITGIGTTNYLPKFTGSGTIGDSQIFDDGTNVGIGTTTPQARLDVRAQGALSTDIAFRVRNSTDTRSFLVVNGAGDVFNNGAGGGETNTHFGENTARARTGDFNSTFGNQAGRDLSTGASNALFGYNAGSRITTQNGNTLIGSRAGESTIVNNTVAVGVNSLLLNQTGTSNVAVGAEALYVTTASGNTAVGDGAGFRNTTGQRNIFLGYASGRSNTTGQYNTYIGVDSGTYQTTGNDNIFLGISSGRYQADDVTNLTTATNSLFIGNNTRGNASGQTNQIVIGHNAIGDGSNSVVLGNSSITRTRLQGQVIIGTFATPPTGIEGAIYYDSSKKIHYGFDGINWNPLY